MPFFATILTLLSPQSQLTRFYGFRSQSSATCARASEERSVPDSSPSSRARGPFPISWLRKTAARVRDRRPWPRGSSPRGFRIRSPFPPAPLSPASARVDWEMPSQFGDTPIKALSGRVRSSLGLSPLEQCGSAWYRFW